MCVCVCPLVRAAHLKCSTPSDASQRSQERLWPNVKLGCVQTSGRPAAPLPFPTATRQLMDLFLPSLAVMLNTLFTCKATTTTSTPTIDPEQVPPSALEDSTGGKSCSEIRADAAETDGCNNAPKTAGGSSDTLQMKDADSGNTRPLG